jgi:hypothetical protein
VHPVVVDVKFIQLWNVGRRDQRRIVEVLEADVDTELGVADDNVSVAIGILI